MKRSAIILSLVVALAGFMALNAQAASITGGISLGGDVTFSNSNLSNNPLSITSFSNDFVTSGNGSYASVPGLTPVGITPFNIYPTLTQTITPLWAFTYGGNTYLMNVTSASIISDSSTSITITGNGTMEISGYTNTPGTFTFTASSANDTFSFSESSSAVPEPATLLLLGSGLVGLAAFRKRFKQA